MSLPDWRSAEALHEEIAAAVSAARNTATQRGVTLADVAVLMLNCAGNVALVASAEAGARANLAAVLRGYADTIEGGHHG